MFLCRIFMRKYAQVKFKEYAMSNKKLALFLACCASAGFLSCNEQSDWDSDDAVCVTGTKTCTNNAVNICKDGVWTVEKQCEGATPNCDSNTYECVAGSVAACEENKMECKDNALRICRYGSWTSLDCGSDRVCNADKGRCDEKTVDDACTNGATKCDGNKLVTCTDGSWDAGTDCGDKVCGADAENAGAYKCNDGGTEDTCTDGATKCDGNKLVTCTNGSWDAGTDCGEKVCGADADNAGAYKCNEAGSDNTCTEEGATKCDGNKLVTCTNGSWDAGTDCGDKVCGADADNAGAYKCNEAGSDNTCTEAGATKCDGNKLVTCTDGSWDAGTDCSTDDKVCGGDADNAGAYKCNDKSTENACETENATRCTDSGLLQTCLSGQWAGDVDCSADDKVCGEDADNAGAYKCNEKVDETKCEAEGATKCDGNKLVTCTNGAWDDGIDCEAKFCGEDAANAGIYKCNDEAAGCTVGEGSDAKDYAHGDKFCDPESTSDVLECQNGKLVSVNENCSGDTPVCIADATDGYKCVECVDMDSKCVDNVAYMCYGNVWAEDWADDCSTYNPPMVCGINPNYADGITHYECIDVPPCTSTDACNEDVLRSASCSDSPDINDDYAASATDLICKADCSGVDYSTCEYCGDKKLMAIDAFRMEFCDVDADGNVMIADGFGCNDVEGLDPNGSYVGTPGCDDKCGLTVGNCKAGYTSIKAIHADYEKLLEEAKKKSGKSDCADFTASNSALDYSVKISGRVTGLEAGNSYFFIQEDSTDGKHAGIKISRNENSGSFKTVAGTLGSEVLVETNVIRFNKCQIEIGAKIDEVTASNKVVELVEPVEISVDELNKIHGDYNCSLVTVKDMKADSYNDSDQPKGWNTLVGDVAAKVSVIFTSKANLQSWMKANGTYSVTGVSFVYNSTPAIAPRIADDIVETCGDDAYRCNDGVRQKCSSNTWSDDACGTVDNGTYTCDEAATNYCKLECSPDFHEDGGACEPNAPKCTTDTVATYCADFMSALTVNADKATAACKSDTECDYSCATNYKVVEGGCDCADEYYGADCSVVCNATVCEDSEPGKTFSACTEDGECVYEIEEEKCTTDTVATYCADFMSKLTWNPEKATASCKTETECEYSCATNYKVVAGGCDCADEYYGADCSVVCNATVCESKEPGKTFMGCSDIGECEYEPEVPECVVDVCDEGMIRICDTVTNKLGEAKACENDGNFTQTCEIDKCVHNGCVSGFDGTNCDCDLSTNYWDGSACVAKCTADVCSGDKIQICDKVSGKLGEAKACENDGNFAQTCDENTCKHNGCVSGFDGTNCDCDLSTNYWTGTECKAQCKVGDFVECSADGKKVVYKTTSCETEEVGCSAGQTCDKDDASHCVSVVTPVISCEDGGKYYDEGTERCAGDSVETCTDVGGVGTWKSSASTCAYSCTGEVGDVTCHTEPWCAGDNTDYCGILSDANSEWSCVSDKCTFSCKDGYVEGFVGDDVVCVNVECAYVSLDATNKRGYAQVKTIDGASFEGYLICGDTTKTVAELIGDGDVYGTEVNSGAVGVAEGNVEFRSSEDLKAGEQSCIFVFEHGTEGMYACPVTNADSKWPAPVKLTDDTVLTSDYIRTVTIPGSSVTPSCTKGETRCGEGEKANVLYTCGDDGWDTGFNCPSDSGKVCVTDTTVTPNVSSCQPASVTPSCTKGETKCGEGEDANVLYTCGDDGWDKGTDCTASKDKVCGMDKTKEPAVAACISPVVVATIQSTFPSTTQQSCHKTACSGLDSHLSSGATDDINTFNINKSGYLTLGLNKTAKSAYLDITLTEDEIKAITGNSSVIVSFEAKQNKNDAPNKIDVAFYNGTSIVGDFKTISLDTTKSMRTAELAVPSSVYDRIKLTFSGHTNTTAALIYPITISAK